MPQQERRGSSCAITSSPHVLTLGEGEAVASVLQKLECFSGERIVLVANGDGGALHNPVSVRLLQRKARDLDVNVAVISGNEFTRRLCKEAGFHTYYASQALKDGAWALDRSSLAQLRGISFNRWSWMSRAAAVSLLLALISIAVFVTPAATISLVPAPRAVAVTVPVVASLEQNDLDVVHGIIPARLASAEMSGSRTVRATGRREAADGTASGVVSFTNSGTEQVMVPRGTVVMAGPARFATSQDNVVVPASAKAGETTSDGAAQAAIVALEPGDAGNVQPAAITSIEGPLAEKLKVTNDSPTTGGTKKQVSYLSADDQRQAKEDLRAQLVEQGLARIREQIPRNQSFVPSSQSESDSAIEGLTFDQSPEQVSDETELHMRVLVKGLTFEGDDVNAVVAQAVRDAARQAGPDARLVNEPLAIEPPTVVSSDGSTIHLQIHATGRVVSPIDPNGLANGVRGLDSVQARTYLREIPGIQTADVQLWPFWARKVPSLLWRIHVQVQNPPTNVQG